MAGTMQAAVLGGYGAELVLGAVPRPVPGPGQILIRLEASGVCHTDVHIWQGAVRPPLPPLPFILGHEGVGEVAALGEGVEDWRIGERAGAAWIHDTCGTCPECRSGHESFCQNHRAHGLNVPGTFAEFVVADARFAARVPDGDAAVLAPLMCAGLTALGAIDRADLKPGECCAVFGCGGLGQYAVQLAQRRGAEVIAVDRDPAKLATSRRNGATQTLDAADTGALEALAARADVCINFAPTTATWAPMLTLLRPRGRLIAAAMVAEPVPLNQEWLTASGVTITGTSVGTRTQMADLMREEVERPLAAEVTEITLAETTEALRALHAGRAPGRFSIRF
ncbi:MAG: alcohol dehydrogenase catalytic domain-containing protein [Proteobacteria bacterium]|nr:alcohol dehydrogenase catalytic domain-containing protein [Pseudomonadota bacterium]